MHAPSVLILKSDRLHADLLQRIVSLVIPKSRCLLTNQAREAQAQLQNARVDLLLTGIDPGDGEVLDLIARCTRGKRSARMVFVITNRREPHILSSLRALPIAGVFDSSTEGLNDLRSALRQICDGKMYWSESLVRHLGRSCYSPHSPCRVLTRSEKRVFAVIGDGSDDDAAARHLGLKPSTVTTVRRAIHRKLRVRQRGELVRLAVFSGFVCFASGSVVRPGFSLLAAKRRVRKSKPILTSRI